MLALTQRREASPAPLPRPPAVVPAQPPSAWATLTPSETLAPSTVCHSKLANHPANASRHDPFAAAAIARSDSLPSGPDRDSIFRPSRLPRLDFSDWSGPHDPRCAPHGLGFDYP